MLQLTAIASDGRLLTSQWEIANCLANHFYDSVKNIRESFSNENETALNVLRELKVKQNKKFDFVEIDSHQMYNIISKAKKSRTLSNDSTSMDMI